VHVGAALPLIPCRSSEKGGDPGPGAGEPPLGCLFLGSEYLPGGWQGAVIRRIEIKTVSRPCGKRKLDQSVGSKIAVLMILTK